MILRFCHPGNNMHASSSQSINIWDAKSISCAFPGLPMLDKGAHGQNIGPVRGLLCKAVAGHQNIA